MNALKNITQGEYKTPIENDMGFFSPVNASANILRRLAGCIV